MSEGSEMLLFLQRQRQCHLADPTPLSSTGRRRRFDARLSSTPPPLQTTSVDADVPPRRTHQRCRCHSLSPTQLKAFLSVHRRQTPSTLFSLYVLSLYTLFSSFC